MWYCAIKEVLSGFFQHVLQVDGEGGDMPFSSSMRMKAGHQNLPHMQEDVPMNFNTVSFWTNSAASMTAIHQLCVFASSRAR